jgi:hypothetical protein
MSPKAMRWMIYLGIGVAIVQMLGGCDNHAVEQAAPENPAVERPVNSAPSSQRNADQRLRDDLYRDWPKPNLRPTRGSDGRS